VSEDPQRCLQAVHDVAGPADSCSTFPR
jgi:hypothetical protein